MPPGAASNGALPASLSGSDGDQMNTGSTVLRASSSQLGECQGFVRHGRAPQLRLVMESAFFVAENWSLPLVAEIATLIGVLANLSANYLETERNMPKTVRWCASMLKIIESSDINQVGCWCTLWATLSSSASFATFM